jgi:hypothetical protein
MSCEPVPINGVPSRAAIMQMEAVMLEMPQVALEVIHHFSKGIYARELRIPKGTILTGQIHRHEHLNIISQGDITVLTEAGMQRIKAPYTLLSLPGIKRAGYAHEDTVWTTIHATEETDLEKLEQMFIAPSFEALEHTGEKTCLG